MIWLLKQTHLKIKIQLYHLNLDATIGIVNVKNENDVHTGQVERDETAGHLQRAKYNVLGPIIENVVHWQIDQNIAIRTTNPNVALFCLLRWTNQIPLVESQCGETKRNRQVSLLVGSDWMV